MISTAGSRALEAQRRAGKAELMRLHDRYRSVVALLFAGAVSAGCLGEASPEGSGSVEAGSAFSEGFEAGSKTSYAGGNVRLGTGTWNLSDALIGTSSSDVKTGAKAARMRNSGHITMGFDRTTGAGTVTIHHARFGSDASGSWGLFASQDQGSTWTQVGATVSTTTTAFATATFTVNLAGSVRFDIRKLDGGSNKIDIDDVAITDAAGGSGSGGSGGSGGGSGGGGGGSGSGGGSGALRTVFVIVMENHNWSDVKGSGSAPYINGTLLPMGAHAENYVNVPGIHPSEPNYLWLEAGTNFGVLNDNNPSSNHQGTTQHLVTQLQAAGIAWKSYQEDISGTTCPLTATGLYAPKHNPMVFFDDVTGTNSGTSSNCIQHVRPYTELATDLQNNTVARYNFITPNLCDDMHNATGCATSDEISNGDTWLSHEMPTILASKAYQNNGVVFITWDESEGGDFPIGMIVLSPKVKQPGYSNTILYNHGSTLRSVQEIFGVTPLLGGAATSTDLGDLFTSFP
jgi:phosphatidylinositol-3-phosphatase